MTAERNPLPRELRPGIVWLGDCWEVPFRGTTLHSYNSVYLVEGERCALLVEAGHPQDLDVIQAQLEARLAATGLALSYVFATHQETPHSAGIGRVLSSYPSAQLVGDVRDYHFVFPEYEDRFRPMRVGESLDLGGTKFSIVEAVIKDLPSTQWGFDASSRTLFPGDGFAFAHYHDAGMCGRFAEEVVALPIAEMTARFAENALYWTTFTPMDPFVARLEALIARCGIEMIAPTHGLPIGDIEATLPAIAEGLRACYVGPDAGDPPYVDNYLT